LGSQTTPGNMPRRVPGKTTFYLLHERNTPMPASWWSIEESFKVRLWPIYLSICFIKTSFSKFQIDSYSSIKSPVSLYIGNVLGSIISPFSAPLCAFLTTSSLCLVISCIAAIMPINLETLLRFLYYCTFAQEDRPVSLSSAHQCNVHSRHHIVFS
jgi:hypothetical protein